MIPAEFTYFFLHRIIKKFHQFLRHQHEWCSAAVRGTTYCYCMGKIDLYRIVKLVCFPGQFVFVQLEFKEVRKCIHLNIVM